MSFTLEEVSEARIKLLDGVVFVGVAPKPTHWNDVGSE